MATTKQDHLIKIKTNSKNSQCEGVPLFAISDFLCSNEFKRLQDEIFRNFETFMAQQKIRAEKEAMKEEAQENSRVKLTAEQQEMLDKSQNCAKDLFTEVDSKYICKICGKELKKSNSIEDHIRTHTGEKPYKVWNFVLLCIYILHK